MTHFAILSTVRCYVGKLRTLRNEICTARLLDALPPEVRCDIGWPERRNWRQGHK